mmetsp:Transcript_50347/g.145130  ORF Transcript_50347/g.145130 Transcript_50347/m.145130 type:complete len:296 (-) Transcript_50347:53-940(-)
MPQAGSPQPMTWHSAPGLSEGISASRNPPSGRGLNGNHGCCAASSSCATPAHASPSCSSGRSTNLSFHGGEGACDCCCCCRQCDLCCGNGFCCPRRMHADGGGRASSGITEEACCRPGPPGSSTGLSVSTGAGQVRPVAHELASSWQRCSERSAAHRGKSVGSGGGSGGSGSGAMAILSPQSTHRPCLSEQSGQSSKSRYDVWTRVSHDRHGRHCNLPFGRSSEATWELQYRASRCHSPCRCGGGSAGAGEMRKSFRGSGSAGGVAAAPPLGGLLVLAPGGPNSQGGPATVAGGM